MTDATVFEWTAPAAFEKGATDIRRLLDPSSLARRAIAQAAEGRGLDPSTVRIVRVATTSGGDVVTVEAAARS